MKPIHIKQIHSANYSFSIEERVRPGFTVPYHFHNEYELTAILKGSGSRFIGNNISDFTDRDMVLVGKNLPHHWHNNEEDHGRGVEDAVKSIVLKFDSEFNGVRLFDLPENYEIQQLLERASGGLSIKGATFDKLVSLMQQLLQASGPDRISLLLKILHEIAVSENVETLSTEGKLAVSYEFENHRMNRVYDYIMSNYLDDISLTEVASVACMNEAAFCKYFKKRYNKTFIQVVSELRISYACRELIKEDSNITDICYRSGFKTFSNFTKSFKKITGTSPREYKLKVSKQK
ncbi:AraC family transcriptional regulator [Flavihumibacter sp. UBA7668]|uniref:AraC family transcriptional regulator n=1 Tax=Flavihumibacter sp. UBA7668 TaxID=1946542 RepID=UPI0025C37BC4|nr:AraC family transcriptional regulator [Flavihumibacter sp. UBA7668]